MSVSLSTAQPARTPSTSAPILMSSYLKPIATLAAAAAAFGAYQYSSKFLGALGVGLLAARSWINQKQMSELKIGIRNLYEEMALHPAGDKAAFSKRYENYRALFPNDPSFKTEKEMLNLIYGMLSPEGSIPKEKMIAIEIRQLRALIGQPGANSAAIEIRYCSLLDKLQKAPDCFLHAEAWSQITEIYNFLRTVPMAASPIQTLAEFSCTPGNNNCPRLLLSNANKLLAYETLTSMGMPFQQPMVFSKHSLADREKVKQMPVFANPTPETSEQEGVFPYPVDTDDTIHWTANFADRNIFGFCGTGLLAQDELQVVEHPGMAHLRIELNQKGQTRLEGHEIALVQNAQRCGKLNMYGNGFGQAPAEVVKRNLEKFQRPTASNIFVIAGPRAGTPGQPYDKAHLEDLFYPAYIAFKAIKEKNPGKKVVIHTGNWTAGAFGGHPKAAALCQLAAARCAGVDVVNYYPLKESVAFQGAANTFNHYETFLKARNEDHLLTVDGFLTGLADRTTDEGLFYREGNGT